MKQNKNTFKLLQKNRKAYFNYEVIEDLECGIALVGTEVKSIRDGKFSFSDSYVTVTNNALTLVGLTIQAYTHGNLNNHEPLRNRRLLAHKAEIKKFKRKVDERGFTLIPTSIYLRGNLVKVQISLCRGKQGHDKRADAKEKDINRDTRRELKQMQY
ncbi:MAG: SsrA-binding protein SmpB [Sphaerochaeta sp.]|nr:SsrA-binding protein SmpB [Sphaerochaeta sp.]